jgi:hypothetical protein
MSAETLRLLYSRVRYATMRLRSWYYETSWSFQEVYNLEIEADSNIKNRGRQVHHLSFTDHHCLRRKRCAINDTTKSTACQESA